MNRYDIIREMQDAMQEMDAETLNVLHQIICKKEKRMRGKVNGKGIFKKNRRSDPKSRSD